MTEPEGKIYIDGVDICKLGLHDVRSSISIIPQVMMILTKLSYGAKLPQFNSKILTNTVVCIFPGINVRLMLLAATKIKTFLIASAVCKLCQNEKYRHIN